MVVDGTPLSSEYKKAQGVNAALTLEAHVTPGEAAKKDEDEANKAEQKALYKRDTASVATPVPPIDPETDL